VDESFCNDDTIIFSFNKEEFVCDISTLQGEEEKEEKDIQLKIGPRIFNSFIPNYFYMGTNMFFMNALRTIDGLRKMNFTPIFSNNPKYVKSDGVASAYNVIYHTNNSEDAFAIVKMKSSNKRHRFLMAYNDDYFTRGDIVQLVNCILTENHEFDDC
jgi:hypothetical protein